MKSTIFSILRRNGATVHRTIFRSYHAVIRCLSTGTNTPAEAPPLETESPSEPSLQATLHAELTSRPVNKSVEYISPTSWNLLNISLADFLPPSCQPRSFNSSDEPTNSQSLIQTPIPLGHHLVYFPPAIPDSSLIADGTDSLHSPGAPFVKRLWGGGSIVFNPQERYQIVPNKLAACGEQITDVKIKGNEGEEKVFVTVQRRLASMAGAAIKGSNDKTRKVRKAAFVRMDKSVMEKWDQGDGMGPWAVIEERNLVFLREKSREEAKEDLGKVARVVKPVHTPDFSVSLTPNPALLFRFSALSFNAHRIHLDPQYTREIEGHRNLLVHGPLTLVLMLSVLRSQIPEAKMVHCFDYRNLAPLYVDEEMKICVRKDPEREDKLEIWVEGRDGGLAVKGTAVIGEVKTLEKADKIEKPSRKRVDGGLDV